MPENGLLLSVVVVTYNTRPDLLAWALDSIAQQSMPKSCFEVVVVDNNSHPPLAEAQLQAGRGLNLRLIRETRQGNTFARCTGIAAAAAPILVFVDDDNHLDPDYLETGYRIACAQPALGAFGGVSRGVFEARTAEWKKRLLPFLGVRDYGPRPITSREDRWGEWEPIGAGMVFRKEVGAKFIEMVRESRAARLLGRKGALLMSGEDSLIARAAYRLGYACSYQPELKMSHCMKARRMRAKVLAGTMLGHGRSYVLLRQVLGEPLEQISAPAALVELARRLRFRLRADGVRAGTVRWCWDAGYFYQLRLENRRAPQFLRQREEQIADIHSHT
ncbi:MAG TPA: glycosyltransferase [Bryobacteraceae bacterium]|nr:glycosyltransferase [Bryobacteraceae bacterium]